jgi:hypothetical protein
MVELDLLEVQARERAKEAEEKRGYRADIESRARSLLTRAQKQSSKKGRGTAEQRKAIKISALDLLEQCHVPAGVHRLMAYLLCIGPADIKLHQAFAFVEAAAGAMVVGVPNYRPPSISRMARYIVDRAGGDVDTRRAQLRARRRSPEGREERAVREMLDQWHAKVAADPAFIQTEMGARMQDELRRRLRALAGLDAK